MKECYFYMKIIETYALEAALKTTDVGKELNFQIFFKWQNIIIVVVMIQNFFFMNKTSCNTRFHLSQNYRLDDSF